MRDFFTCALLGDTGMLGDARACFAFGVPRELVGVGGLRVICIKIQVHAYKLGIAVMYA